MELKPDESYFRETLVRVLVTASLAYDHTSAVNKAVDGLLDRLRDFDEMVSLSPDMEMLARQRIAGEVRRLYNISGTGYDAVVKAKKLLTQILDGDDLEDEGTDHTKILGEEDLEDDSIVHDKILAGEDVKDEGTVLPTATKVNYVTIGQFALTLFILVMATYLIWTQHRQYQQLKAEIAQTQAQVVYLQSRLNNTSSLHRDEIGFLGSLFDHIVEAGNVLGGRIDHIWESLGPPNANGTYYTVTETPENSCKDDVEHKMRLAELDKKVKSMERYIRRLDLRLSNELELLREWKY